MVGANVGVEDLGKERLEDAAVLLVVELDVLADGPDRLVAPPAVAVDGLEELRRLWAVRQDVVGRRLARVLDAGPDLVGRRARRIDLRLDVVVVLADRDETVSRVGGRAARLLHALGELADVGVGLLDLVAQWAALGLDVARQLGLLGKDLTVKVGNRVLEALNRLADLPLKIL